MKSHITNLERLKVYLQLYTAFVGKSISGIAEDLGYSRDYLYSVASGKASTSDLIVKAVEKKLRLLLNEPFVDYVNDNMEQLVSEDSSGAMLKIFILLKDGFNHE